MAIWTQGGIKKVGFANQEARRYAHDKISVHFRKN